MRVAMLGSFPQDTDRIPGGVEAVINNLGLALARIPEVELHILTCVPGLSRARTWQHGEATIHYLPGVARLGNLTGHRVEQRRLRARLNELKPDIVHGHGSGRYASAALGSGFPCVITVHGIRYREVVLFGGIKGWARRVTTVAMEKKVLRRARHIFVIADYVRDAIAPLTSATFHPVANPVAEKFFAMETTDSGHTVLSVAAIQPRKGLLHLVEAMAEVKKAVPEARLRLVGKILVPEYADTLSNRIKKLGLQDSVSLLGFVAEDRLLQEFKSCSVFALCSVEESSPVAVAEALSLGKPVVASAVGGIPHLVENGASGFLTRYGDVDSIAQALARLLGDDKLRSSMGSVARAEAVDRFHPDAAAGKTLAVYGEILADRA